jgi:hypothetical protein
VTVTDTAASPLGTPAGGVGFGSSPSSGTFVPAGCTLDATGACDVDFTPAVGGDYTVTASYNNPDADHTGSTGTASITAVDPTKTAITCAPTTVQIGSSTSCTATLTDPLAIQPPIGEVSFTASPTTGSFGTAEPTCTWTQNSPGPGGSATCLETYTATAPGDYTLTAAYGGDSSHAKSSGTFKVTATTVPSNGGPGSHGGGGGSLGTVTIGGSSGPPPPGTVSVAPRAKVKRKHAQVILTCAGTAGSSCRGALALTAKTKVKVKVKVKVKTHAKRKGKGKGKGRSEPKTRTKIKIKTVKKTIQVGVIAFTLATGSTQAVSVKLSKPAAKLFAKAKHGRLKTKALVDGSVVRTVTLSGKHKKQHKHHKGGGHKKHKK